MYWRITRRHKPNRCFPPRNLPSGAKKIPIRQWVRARKAGEGNRTLVVGLGSRCSTIELHPQDFVHGRAATASWIVKVSFQQHLLSNSLNHLGDIPARDNVTTGFAYG